MAIAFDNSGSADNAGTTSLTWSHTCAGSDRILIVATHHRNVGADVTGVTYNSVAMTQIGTGQAAANGLIRLWYLVAPATGANTVAATLSASQRIAGVSASYTGVNQSTPIGTSAKAASLSVAVTSATDELVVAAGGTEEATATTGSYTGGTGTTVRVQDVCDSGANDYNVVLGDEAGAASTTISYTYNTGTSNGDGIIGVPLKPAAGGTTYYLLNTATGDNWGDVQTGGSAPATATTTTGWTVGTTASGNYSKMAFASERAANTFSGTAVPGTAPDNSLKDAYRIGPLTGSFAAGDWTVSVPVIADTAQGGADGRIRVRVFKSANADGSSSSELTAGAVQLSIVTDLTTGAQQVSSGTVTLGSITLTAEYLFFSLAWEITGAAS